MSGPFRRYTNANDSFFHVLGKLIFGSGERRAEERRLRAELEREQLEKLRRERNEAERRNPRGNY